MEEKCGSARGLRRKMNKSSKLLSQLENFLWQNSPYVLNGPRIFRNNAFNIRTTIYHFFVVACLLVQAKASSYAHVAWSWHKRNQRQSKPTRIDTGTGK